MELLWNHESCLIFSIRYGEMVGAGAGAAQKSTDSATLHCTTDSSNLKTNRS
jgi:hypothetical protein